MYMLVNSACISFARDDGNAKPIHLNAPFNVFNRAMLVGNNDGESVLIAHI